MYQNVYYTCSIAEHEFILRAHDERFFSLIFQSNHLFQTLKKHLPRNKPRVLRLYALQFLFVYCLGEFGVQTSILTRDK